MVEDYVELQNNGFILQTTRTRRFLIYIRIIFGIVPPYLFPELQFLWQVQHLNLDLQTLWPTQQM